MSASRGMELDTEGSLHPSIHAMEKEVADGYVHILVRCSTRALSLQPSYRFPEATSTSVCGKGGAVVKGVLQEHTAGHC